MDEITRNQVDRIKTQSTSNNELKKKIGKKINVIKYSELKDYNNIDELLAPNGMFIMLYETSDNMGHWTCCFNRGKNIISFFDSLGLKPDDQFHEISIQFRKDSGIDKPFLTYLLSNSNKKVEWNEYDLQSMNPEIATCGRWCVLRLKMKHLSPKQFHELFKSGDGFDSDDLAVLAY